MIECQEMIVKEKVMDHFLLLIFQEKNIEVFTRKRKKQDMELKISK